MATVAFPDRMLRGWAAGFVATLFAAIGHFPVSGTLPGFPGMVMAFAASGFVCSLFAGRRMGPGRVTAAVLASQGPYHLLFSAPAAMAVDAAAYAQHQAGHHGHGQPAVRVALDAAFGAGAAGGAAMWMAHLAAAALTVLAVSRAERFVWMLAGLLGVRLVRLVRLLLPVAPPPRPAPASRREPAALPGRPAARPIARRGPPSCAAPRHSPASAPVLA
ncbi:hypothetical protein NCCP1664_24480 [Zafaria cholistanensis]|uniref:Uncharacterized protein n=1 Tax=Zafaria cholistanensis TaxID=1682741 RepID=A0A5A7NT47_9MICC|nr:hypothetical protein [Zafaria cholistanensis]GER23953.1 hypothetical protein NCCP1664_24480 [Zafaria cholistanensis]